MSSVNLHDDFHGTSIYFSQYFQKKWLKTIDKTGISCYNRTIRTAQPIPRRGQRTVPRRRGSGMTGSSRDAVPAVLITPNHAAFPVRSSSERASERLNGNGQPGSGRKFRFRKDA